MHSESGKKYFSGRNLIHFMFLSKTDRSAYLKRIGFEKTDLVPSFEDLCVLQRVHLLSVPFENLDIHLGRKIALENSFDKIVFQWRGGFCYELNGLFYQLLKDIGFNVQIISGRVYNKAKKSYPPEFDHMALTVKLNGQEYLVDVGNGEFALQPLIVKPDIVQVDPRGKFIIEKTEDDYLLVSKIGDDDKTPQYIFTLEPRIVADFLPMLHYQQTSPDSHFVKNRLCTLPTETGRITISGNTIKIKIGETVEEKSLASDEEFQKALFDHFGIRP
ncbi:MAG TPA: arylamine N-acetyltransferase [Cyclobacteriaceae bacterium]|nr:arylamine N-acetyltransferase [Cyclobacteriaceae bacterium]